MPEICLMRKPHMNSAETAEKVSTKAPRLLGSSRFAVCLMNFIAIFILSLIRANISLSMICIVRIRDSSELLPLGVSNSTSPESRSLDNESQWLNHNILGNESSQDNVTLPAKTSEASCQGEFEWTRSFQGHVLSSFFYGYLSTMFLGGWLGGRYGGKHVISAALLMASIATMLTPLAVRYNKYLIIVLRVITGMSLGPVLPTASTLGGLWYTPQERSFLTTIQCNGSTLGNIVAFFLSAAFCSISVDNGWPFSFYATGGAGFIAWICWNIFVFSSPNQHPRISRREKEYITTSTGIKAKITQRPPFPWFKAVTSPALLAVQVAQLSNAWFQYTALTSMPLYLRDVMQFDIRQNGLWLILPNVLTLVTNIPSGYVADYVIRKRLLRIVTVRKIFQILSSWGSSSLLLALSFMDYDKRYIAASLLTAVSPIQTLGRSGYLVNPMDFAPRYSGEILGISTTFSTLSGVLAPLVVGYLTTTGTKQEWQTVFYIASGLFASGGLFFLLFARGTVLPWADRSNIVREAEDEMPNAKAKKQEAEKMNPSTLTSDSTVLFPVCDIGSSCVKPITVGEITLALSEEEKVLFENLNNGNSYQ